ncbi:MAG: response regulator transcription factor [Rhodocyclales bacterium]|nr:response regulator transcription factor [Rhodocyclales bacterium]
MPELKILIVDDEAPARARLRELLGDVAGEVPNRVLGEAGNGLAAIALIEREAPDVVLVDIRMPTMDGIELAQHLAQLERPPAVIFATAYDAYAIKAFDLNAVDYLLKPVRAQRLATALGKARVARPLPTEMLQELQPEGRSHLSCHERGRLLLIPVGEVLYLKADLKYVLARTREREYLLDESLTHLEQEFTQRFIRLHRGVLVAREAIVGFERNGAEDADTHWLALVRDVPEKLPVSRRQWPLVKSYARQLST